MSWFNSNLQAKEGTNIDLFLQDALAHFDLLPFSQSAHIAWSMMSSSINSYHQYKGLISTHTIRTSGHPLSIWNYKDESIRTFGLLFCTNKEHDDEK